MNHAKVRRWGMHAMGIGVLGLAGPNIHDVLLAATPGPIPAAVLFGGAAFGLGAVIGALTEYINIRVDRALDRAEQKSDQR